jgi:hypothetical protein
LGSLITQVCSFLSTRVPSLIVSLDNHQQLPCCSICFSQVLFPKARLCCLISVIVSKVINFFCLMVCCVCRLQYFYGYLFLSSVSFFPFLQFSSIFLFDSISYYSYVFPVHIHRENIFDTSTTQCHILFF